MKYVVKILELTLILFEIDKEILLELFGCIVNSGVFSDVSLNVFGIAKLIYGVLYY